MSISYSEYFILFVTSLLLVSLLTPVMRRIAIRRQILDHPTSPHKSQTHAVPYLGGISIIIGVLLVSYLSLVFSQFTSDNFWLATSVLGPAFALGLIGLWDDLKNLTPISRFISQNIAGLFIAAVLVSSDNIGSPSGIMYIDTLITIFWVVGICNAINFFDNLDGGAAGTTAITAVFLTYLALNNGQSFIAALSIVVAGACLGFLIWNKTPARIYMGDAGALFLGVLLATLTIRLNPSAQTTFGSFATPVLLLALPILDTTVAVFSRVRRGVSPFQGGQDHLSHRLIRMGVSRKLSAVILWFLSAVFGLGSVILTIVTEELEVFFLTSIFCLWSLLFIFFFRVADE